MAQNQYGTDGALDRVLRLGQKQKSTPAIFIHAGAGFHSHQNERVHLKACVSAAEMGMRFLKAGATATEAVEAALRILEDKEITNAGFGSNLSIDGTVECDATIVDHLGRSGACGAVPNIRNPISLAKLILDTSNMPLSLRRVPPNALVGDGARAFAEEHGMPTFANEYLVSKNSHDRFFRWQEDLMRAEGRIKDTKLSPVPVPKAMACVPCQYDTAAALDPHRRFPREHTAAILAGTWNEGQIDSPYAGTPLPESSNLPESAVFSGHSRPLGLSLPPASRSSLQMPMSQTPLTPCKFPDTKKDGVLSAKPKGNEKCADALSAPRNKVEEEGLDDDEDFEPRHDGSATPQSYPGTRGTAYFDNNLELDASRDLKRSDSAATSKDLVTDTIGAIAIDERGQIAAGSSSGGIGMKHRGRLGPAALVGIGTAVVPCAEKDEEGVTVAAVTSGTGEHMATTMASQRCAERLYQGTRRGPRGFDVEEYDEDAIMESFVADDFMNHPGVRHCHSAGAIGVMAVKKCRAGYYFYFAHNTDSFALASMGGLDKEPHCTMSRLSEGSKIARGGRKIQLA
ncbi:asparaginase domain-containing protein [Hirsutella rhossiliensis]|uniref:Asparaginase domain-containing protein n=1 Tax=Hirsutella rhossiliensis TaxID=111463 RepID=A0A9P8MX24_9HYPO|nr:asparaginase domain-containing protein [Hirsutella rhossiliensis]KAH0960747.1 asparaginase domain-containing protein [Hirsutella rhossiliensis]